MADETSCVGCRYLDIYEKFDITEYYCLRFSKLLFEESAEDGWGRHQPPKPRRNDCFVTRVYTKSEDE